MTLASLPSQLQNDITALIKKDPESETTIKQIIKYYEGKLTEVGKLNHKKLKTENAPTQTNSADRSVLPQTLEGSQIMLQIPDLSIQSPFRKKVNMVIGAFKGKAPFITFTKAMNIPPEFMLDDLTAKILILQLYCMFPRKRLQGFY